MMSSDYLISSFIEKVVIDNKIQQSDLAVVEVHQEITLTSLFQYYAGRFTQ